MPIARGAPLAMASRTLGHSTLTLTLDPCGHLSAAALQGAAAAMDAIFGTTATGHIPGMGKRMGKSG